MEHKNTTQAPGLSRYFQGGSVAWLRDRQVLDGQQRVVGSMLPLECGTALRQRGAADQAETLIDPMIKTPEK